MTRLAVFAALVLILVTALMPAGRSGGSQPAPQAPCVEQPGATAKALAERCRGTER